MGQNMELWLSTWFCYHLTAKTAAPPWPDPYRLQWACLASQIISLTIVYSTVCSFADQRKYQSSTSLAFVQGIHRWPVNSPQKASNSKNVSIWWCHHAMTWPIEQALKGNKAIKDLSLITIANRTPHNIHQIIQDLYNKYYTSYT